MAENADSTNLKIIRLLVTSAKAEVMRSGRFICRHEYLTVTWPLHVV